jgi:hypothetical protein
MTKIEIFKIHQDKKRKDKKIQLSHGFDESNSDEMIRNRRRKRKLEINKKLLDLGASNFKACIHNTSLMSVFYKIEKTKISIIYFKANNKNGYSEESMYSTIHEIKKSEIKTISELEKGFNILTSSVSTKEIQILCTSALLKNELLTVIGAFHLSQNKKRVGVIKL